MEEEVGIAVAQALHPKLSAFLAIDGLHLRAVRHIEDCGSLSRVILGFGHTSLIIDAIADDDSIDLKSAKTSDIQASPTDGAIQSSFWQDFIDVPFGWGWITINQQGYCDGLLLSFGGIEAQVLMNVMASSIKLKRLST